MTDSDLEAIRAARMQQLQSQPSSAPSAENASSSQEEQKASILSQILEPLAADRLGRIRMVNAQRAEDVENRLIMLARSGQLRQRVTEEQLKDILGAVAKQNEERAPEKAVVVQRRKGGWDEDDLDDLLAED